MHQDTSVREMWHSDSGWTARLPVIDSVLGHLDRYVTCDVEGTPVKTLLSTADAARILGVTPATVRLMERQGRLPSAGRTVGGIRLFRRAKVEAVAKRRAKKSN